MIEKQENATIKIPTNKTNMEENKIDWSKIDITILAKKIAESYIKFERKKHEEWKAYWHYELYTPIYLKIWHKLTFKKTPKY